MRPFLRDDMKAKQLEESGAASAATAQPPRWARRLRGSVLIAAMGLAILTIAALSLWDIRRRHAESMEDFGLNQQRLARSLASNFEARLSAVGERREPDFSSLLVGLSQLEQPGTAQIYVWPPGAPGFVSTKGAPVSSQLFQEAIREGRGYVRMSRELASELGLPERTALVGLAPYRQDADHIYWIAVVTTASRARARAAAASLRTLLAVLVAAGAVLSVGGVALHWQRQELRTQQALAVEDLHRRRETELERASRAATLGTLAMGITHELSTPLGIIAARADQLSTRLHNDERTAHGVQVIQEQAARMGQIIRGLLALVRNEAPIAEKLSPLAVCHGAMKLIRHRFAETGVRLHLEAGPEAEDSLLRGDPRLLEQALVNLLLNACDACGPDCEVELRVQIEEGKVRFSVTDNGSGISQEAASRAMEPFFTTKPVGKGAGLGLAVTHEIVKSHRGSLRIGPRPERGTCAEIVLPQQAQTEMNSHGY